MVKSFKSNEDIISYESVRHECTLCFGYKFREDFFEAIGYGFGNYLIHDISKTNGWNSFGIEGDFVLVIRAMKMWFIYGGMLPEFKTDRVASIMSKPTIFQ